MSGVYYPRVLILEGAASDADREAIRARVAELQEQLRAEVVALGPRGRLDLGPDRSTFDGLQGKRKAQWKEETRGRRK